MTEIPVRRPGRPDDTTRYLCAASYLDSILGQGDRPFDEPWMRATFDSYWSYAQHVTNWTNALLQPPPFDATRADDVVRLLAASRRPWRRPAPTSTRSPRSRGWR